MSPSPTTPATPTFFGLGIAPRLLDILQRNNYTNPTPIQLKSIPIAVEGKDMIGVAETGTGKTLAFGIPTIQRLAQLKGKRALVLLPTRELAMQVEETFQKIGRPINLRTALLIGGASMERQVQALRKNPHVIIATPGRLIDHLEHKILALHDVAILVLDEADRMLDMGFEPQIKRILQTVPKDRQTLLFSATMPAEIVKIANTYMQIPIRVEIARPGTAAKNVSQEMYFIDKPRKPNLLQKVLEEYRGSVLVFTRTKHGASKLTRILKRMGHTAAEIHSNRSLSQRRAALDGFKNGSYRVLVATDIAARGIDVKGIELVVNYDLPDQAEDYVHRIGRTGRAGQTGHAISFAMPDEKRDVRDIERLLGKPIAVATLPDLPRTMPAVEAERSFVEPRRYGQDNRGYGNRNARGGHPSSSYGKTSYEKKPATYPSYATRGNARRDDRAQDRPSTPAQKGKRNIRIIF